MPELPEVETSRRGIQPHIEGHVLKEIIVRQHRLRWPVDVQQCDSLIGETLLDISRRGKYLLLRYPSGTQLLHLGMSGSLRVLKHGVEPSKHDHLDFVFANQKVLRFNDPRRRSGGRAVRLGGRALRAGRCG